MADFCTDCGLDVWVMREKNYLLRPCLWKKVREAGNTLKGARCTLCIGCIEIRLARPLIPADFANWPINNASGFARSERLRSRVFPRPHFPRPRK